MSDKLSFVEREVRFLCFVSAEAVQPQMNADEQRSELKTLEENLLYFRSALICVHLRLKSLPQAIDRITAATALWY